MKKICKFLFCTLFFFVVFSFFSCGSLFGPNDDSNNNGTQDNEPSKADNSFKKRLNNFGLSTDSYSINRDGVASDWEPLEGDYEIPTMSGKNPDYLDNLSMGGSRNAKGVSAFSSSVFSRMKMSELYLCAATENDQDVDGLYSYEGGITKLKGFTKSDYISNTLVKTKAFDMDGDSHEDIAIASFDRDKNKITLYARLYNASTGTFGDEIVLATIDNDQVGNVRYETTDKDYGFDCYDFNFGDFDGDHKKEFAISLSYDRTDDSKHGKADLYIIDDYNSSSNTRQILHHYTETELFSQIGGSKSSKVFKFACADLNGDGYDEIFASIGANDNGKQGYYKVYGYTKQEGWSENLGNGELNKEGEKYNKLSTAMVDVGDIDGDGEIEVVFEGRQKDYDNTKCLILGYDKSQNKYAFEHSTWAQNKDGSTKFAHKDDPYLPMAICDIDGDGAEEIILYNIALKYIPTSKDTDKVEPFSLNELPCIAENGGLCAGDFNYDGKFEIAQINYKEDKLYISSFNKDTKSFTASAAYDLKKANDAFPASMCAVAAKKGVARFKYKGHYLQFTEPDVVALVAAPLYFSEKYNGGVDPEEFQPSFGNQGTAIGQSSSSSSSVDGTFSINISSSGGLCIKDPTGFTGLEMKLGVTLDETYEHTWGKSESKEIEVSYCTHDKDMIVVKVTPMDVYVYEIANMPGEPSFVGEEYYIALPRESYVKVCEVDFYEEHKSADAPSVKALFTHTAGNPFSYDTYEKCLNKIKAPETTKCKNSDLNKISKNEYFVIDKAKMESLPQGNTEVTMSFSKNSEKYEGDGFEIAAGIEAEFEVQGAYINWGIAFGGGDSWSTSVGKGTSIEGTVVGVDAKYAADFSFRWGIVSYPVAVDGQYLVPMVTYIVE